MAKKIKTIFSFFIIGVLLCSSTLNIYAAENITKEYEFTAESEENLKYDVPDKINDDSGEYKLVSVDYKVISTKEPITVKKTVTSENKSFEKTIKEKVDGKEYLLTADEDKIIWKEVKKSQSREYLSTSEIYGTLTVDGDTYSLNGYDTENRVEKFSSPATFKTSYVGATKYVFNGKTVSITGSEPKWENYKDAVKDYLGIASSAYTIDNGSWNGDFKQDSDGNYVRTATYTGTRTTPVYVATYSYNTYEGEITYVDTENTESVQAKAIAVYEPVNTGLTTLQKILIGAGILVLALLVAIILFYIKKRKKDDNQQPS